jgi:NAD(P)-dependent dehydrogenase (short-subunit alcohol dehydrogenase family)
MELKPVAQQVMVVFGASSGIGRVTALRAAERGAHVVAAARDEAALRSLVAETPTGSVVAAPAEAADPESVRSIADLAVDRFGRLDTWAHVAGTAEYARFEDMTVDEFRRVVDVDLLGPVWGARAALPHLRRNGGAFIVVSSEIAKRGFPLLSSYSAAKHGVDGFLEALRLELHHEGAPVSVTQILPAAISTPFFENTRSRVGVRASGPPPVYPPEKVAKAILYAASHSRRDITVGGAARVQNAMQRISPRLTDVLSRRLIFALGRSREPKAVGDDTLFEAPHGDDRVRGVVTTFHR